MHAARCMAAMETTTELCRCVVAAQRPSHGSMIVRCWSVIMARLLLSGGVAISSVRHRHHSMRHAVGIAWSILPQHKVKTTIAIVAKISSKPSQLRSRLFILRPQFSLSVPDVNPMARSRPSSLSDEARSLSRRLVSQRYKRLGWML